MVSTAWMESMKGRTSGSSAINPNAAGSNIVRGLTEPDTALAPIKDNDAALRVPREMGCSSASTSARSPASTSKCSQLLLGTRASVDQRGALTLRRRNYPAAYCAGLTTAAEPPPRRTGSAAATIRPSCRNSTPVAAPISGVVVNA